MSDRPTQVQPPVKIRAGVIGMGRWGRRLIEEFSRVVDVTACSDRGSGASSEWLTDAVPRARYSRDATTLLRDPAIEAIVIATPIVTHADLALAAFDAGKHVFVEKPLATSVADCDRVIHASKSARRALFVGYTFLYDSGIERLVTLTRSDPITSLNITWHKLGTFDEPLTWNLLTHQVAIAVRLLEVRPTSVAVDRADVAITPLDRMSVLLGFPGDLLCSIELDRRREVPRNTVEITTESGSAFRWAGGLVERRKPDGRWMTEHVATAQPLEREVRAFVRLVAFGVRPISDGPFGRVVTSVIEDVEAQLPRSSDPRRTMP